MGDDERHGALWDGLGLIEVRCVDKRGRCGHEVGDVFYYDSPYRPPRDLCHALLYVLGLYTWRVVTGFPSWEADDPSVYRIHCPSKAGTVWEMRRVERG